MVALWKYVKGFSRAACVCQLYIIHTTPTPPPPHHHHHQPHSAAPAPSNAWCGKPYPSWAYRIPFNDGNFKARITGIDKLADVFLRVVGKEPKAGNPPPILLIPTIGMAHDYLETLEALSAGDRQVILFDPVGVGQSSRRLPAGLLPEGDATEEEALRRWSGMVVETCRAVVDFLELNGTDIHLLGHGAGAIPALEFAAELAAAPSSTVGTVKSVTLADPFVIGGRGALSKPYSAAAQPIPLCVSESVEGFGPVAAVVKAEEARGGTGAGVFDGRWVASPFFDKLGGIPTFISYGSKNEDAGLDEKAAQRIAARVPAGTQVAVKRFKGSALAQVDEPEAYVDWVDENLQRAEGQMRPV